MFLSTVKWCDIKLWRIRHQNSNRLYSYCRIWIHCALKHLVVTVSAWDVHQVFKKKIISTMFPSIPLKCICSLWFWAFGWMVMLWFSTTEQTWFLLMFLCHLAISLLIIRSYACLHKVPILSEQARTLAFVSSLPRGKCLMIKANKSIFHIFFRSWSFYKALWDLNLEATKNSSHI